MASKSKDEVINPPALPVKKTLFPSSTTIRNTILCSSFNVTIVVSFLFPDETETRGAKKDSRVVRGTLYGPGFAVGVELDLRFFAPIRDGLREFTDAMAQAREGDGRGNTQDEWSQW